jgi:hypothetical protein
MSNKVKIKNAINEIEEIYNIDLCRIYTDFKNNNQHLTHEQFEKLYAYKHFFNIFKSLNKTKSLLIDLNK